MGRESWEDQGKKLLEAGREDFKRIKEKGGDMGWISGKKFWGLRYTLGKTARNERILKDNAMNQELEHTLTYLDFTGIKNYIYS